MPPFSQISLLTFRTFFKANLLPQGRLLFPSKTLDCWSAWCIFNGILNNRAWNLHVPQKEWLFSASNSFCSTFLRTIRIARFFSFPNRNDNNNQKPFSSFGPVIESMRTSERWLNFNIKCTAVIELEPLIIDLFLDQLKLVLKLLQVNLFLLDSFRLWLKRRYFLLKYWEINENLR